MKEALHSLWSLVTNLVLSMKATLPYLLGVSSEYRAATEEYPDRVSSRMPEDLPPRYRGLLSNDIERCSGCRYCVEACPVNCIKIETEPGPKGNISWVAVFDIDHSVCMFCGLCVEICPTKSLLHTKEYRGAVTNHGQLIYKFGRGWATPEMKQAWKVKKTESDQIASDLATTESAPIGGELLRRQKKEGT